jgi:hypothetical protein
MRSPSSSSRRTCWNTKASDWPNPARLPLCDETAPKRIGREAAPPPPEPQPGSAARPAAADSPPAIRRNPRRPRVLSLTGPTLLSLTTQTPLLPGA